MRCTAVTRPGQLAILSAVPGGSKRLRGRQIERHYLGRLAEHPELGELRGDARGNTLEVAKWMARWASYADGTTRPTRERICKLARIGITTWKRARRRLEVWGFLGLVEAGTTPEFSSVLHRDDPNTAATYVLCVPRSGVEAKWPPIPARRAVVLTPAREKRPAGAERPPVALIPGSAAAASGVPAPSGAASADAMAGAIRRAGGKTITDGWCTWLGRPFAAAGWSPADLAWAIDHELDGKQHHHDAKIRHPVGWLRARLARWLRADGTPRPSVSAQRQAYREQLAADRARLDILSGRLAVTLALPPDSQVRPHFTPAADPARHAAAIRARMGWP